MGIDTKARTASTRVVIATRIKKTDTENGRQAQGGSH